MRLQVFVSAKRNAGVLQFGALVFLCVFMTACVYVPPVWDVFDEIGYVGSIEEGVTTKQQVLGRFGEPDIRYETGNTFRYEGTSSAGAICIGGAGRAECGTFGEEAWWIIVTFDGRDIVSSVVTSRKYRERTLDDLLTSAKQGSARDQYELGTRYYNSGKRAEGWRWLCVAAHNGLPAAQSRLAFLYRYGHAPVTKSIDQAHIWYGLAASNGDPAAAELQESLARTMTPDQRAQAERLVREWKPDPASCEIETARTVN